MRLTIPRRARLARIVGCSGLAAAVWLAAAPVSAQGTIEFDIEVPRRSGGLLPLSQLKVTVTLADDDPVAFEIEDNEGAVLRIPPTAPNTLSPGDSPVTVDFPLPVGAPGNDSVTLEPPGALPAADPQRRRWVFTFDLLSDFDLNDFCSDTTSAAKETWKVRVLAGSPAMVGVCPLSFFPCGVADPAPECVNCFDCNCLAPLAGDPDPSDEVAVVPGFLAQAQACAGERPAVDVVLALDKSGSMSSSTQGSAPRPKIQALHDAVADFITQWQTLRSAEGGGPAGDQVGLVFFDGDDRAMTEVGVASWSGLGTLLGGFDGRRDLLRDHVDEVAAGGATSIGDAVCAAMSADPADCDISAGAPFDFGNDRRKVLLLMSDGQQNTTRKLKVDGETISTHPTSDPTDLTALPNQDKVQIYSVTVGTGTAVSADINEAVATATGGFYVNSEDDAERMRPFFVDLLQNFLRFNTYQAVRLARASAAPESPFVTTVPLTSTTRGLSIAVLWNRRQGVLRLTATPPAGGSPSTMTGDGSIFMSPTLPLPPPTGEWTLQVEVADIIGATNTGTAGPGGGVPFDLVVLEDDLLVDADLRVVPADYKPGDDIGLEARITRGGRPVLGLGTAAGSRVEARLVRPGNTIGDMLSESTAPSTPPVPSDPSSAADAKLANELDANPDALRREQDTVTLRDDGTGGDLRAGDGVYSGRFEARLPGHHEFLFAVEGVAPGSGRFSRQQVETVHVRAVPDDEQTAIDTSITPIGGGRSRLTAVFTPRTRFGNRMGPGWGNYFWLTAPGSPPFKPVDNLDGTYTATLDFDGDTPPEVDLHFEDTLTTIDDSVPPENLPEPLGDGTVLVPDVAGTGAGAASPWSLSLHAGVNDPRGDLGEVCDGDLSWGLDLEYRFGPRFAAELFYGHDDFDCGDEGEDDDDDLEVDHLSLNGKVYFGSGTWRPFAGAGIGSYDFSPGPSETGYNLFAGVQANPLPRLGVEATARYHFVEVSGADADFLTYHLGLRLRF